jgi:ubiquinone/menaquinone biosynthesis C-methylase UbiE
MIAVTDKVATGALDELWFQFAPQLVVFAALKLGIFATLDNGSKSGANIASVTECSKRGTGMLLNCLAAMGLLEKRGEQYALNDVSRRHFLPDSEDYIGNIFACCGETLKLWLTLPEAVKTGKSTLSIFTEDERRRLNILIADALFQVHKTWAWGLADLLASDPALADHSASVKILDVAAGSAVWSIPFALKYLRADVTAVDLDPVLDVARKYTRQFGVERRYTFTGRDIRHLDFEENKYNLVILGHICHSEGARWSQRLIEKSFRALKADGRLLIMDYVADEERRSELMPLLVALNALLGTEEGDTFTFSQYKKWLRAFGFRDVNTVQIEGRSPVIVGLKDGT